MTQPLPINLTVIVAGYLPTSRTAFSQALTINLFRCTAAFSPGPRDRNRKTERSPGTRQGRSQMDHGSLGMFLVFNVFFPFLALYFLNQPTLTREKVTGA